MFPDRLRPDDIINTAPSCDWAIRRVDSSTCLCHSLKKLHQNVVENLQTSSRPRLSPRPCLHSSLVNRCIPPYTNRYICRICVWNNNDRTIGKQLTGVWGFVVYEGSLTPGVNKTGDSRHLARPLAKLFIRYTHNDAVSEKMFSLPAYNWFLRGTYMHSILYYSLYL